MKKGENKNSGLINAYILNLMRHYDNFSMNEYDLVHKINKRFHHKLRANDVYKLHIKPLIERHWLIQIKNNGEISYIRIGEIRHVRAEETLKDQFIVDALAMWAYQDPKYAGSNKKIVLDFEDITIKKGTIKEQIIKKICEERAWYYSQDGVIREMWEEMEYGNILWEEHLKNQDA